MYAACKTILTKATETELSAEDRLSEIESFCKTLINPKGEKKIDTPDTPNAAE